jgi:Na+-translocating ferredoxin:NAD+ oxidoreductase RNF subunit RnfB
MQFEERLLDSLQFVGVAVVFMTVLGVFMASVLAIANRWLFVFEDPRIDEVEDLLPKANCGACGAPGCRPFAERWSRARSIRACARSTRKTATG